MGKVRRFHSLPVRGFLSIDELTTAIRYCDTTDSVVDSAALTLATGYESAAAGHFTHRVSRTMASGAITTYAYHGADGAPAGLACVPARRRCTRGGARWTSTGPDPDGAGPAAAQVDEAVYDGAGVLVVDNGAVSASRAPIPSLLATGAITERSSSTPFSTTEPGS